MKKASKILAIASVLTFAWYLGSPGQGWAHAAPPHGGGRMMAQATERVSGTIRSVGQMARPNRAWTGTHLSLQTDGQTLDVALGPSDYVESQGVSLRAGDQVVVTGVRVEQEGRSTLVAYEVQKGGQTLRLRNANGRPLWAGGGRRP